MARMLTFAVTVTLLTQITPADAADAVFQYAIPVATPKANSTAFLWIPPDAKQVRGVVMAGMTLAEREMVKDELIRKACAEQQLAIVFLKTGLSSVDIQKTLDDLSKVSGFRELAVAPLFFFGHSAGGPQAKTAAIQFKDRCFGVVQYRGGAPGGDMSVPAGIPALMMIGQFDEFGKQMRDDAGRENWENGRDALAAFRAHDARNLGSIVVEPGAGHFAWSEHNAQYLALFLRKAAPARIPDWSIDVKGPVICKGLKPETGWLTDLAIKTAGETKPAAFNEYNGDKARAAWHFDRELAEATLANHKNGFGKKDQFIRWTDSVWIDAGARFYFTDVKWVGDGQTFEVHPVYADNYPRQKDGKGSQWPSAGKSVGHSKTPIQVRPVGGPVIATGGYTFRMKYDALAPATDPGRVTFLAFSDGDAEYRHTEQVGMLPRGFAGLKAGKDQSITFPPIADQKVGAGPIELKATSDARLPVEYYVAYGPAMIEKGKLCIVQIPARAAFPIEVKVVAYQFGRGLEPRVKTAPPVERSFRIDNP